MENPQSENGHVRIANEIWEALGKYRLSGEEWLVLNCILRKTYGFNKKADIISLSQFCSYTDLPKYAVCRALRKLQVKSIVKTEKVGIMTNYIFNKIWSQWTRDKLKYDREAIFERDGHICFHCKKEYSDDELEVDHLIPLVENGSNKEDNLVTSCRTCNRKRGSTNLIQWQKSNSVKNDNQTVSKKVTKPVSNLTHTIDNTKDTFTKDREVSVLTLTRNQLETLQKQFPLVDVQVSYEKFKLWQRSEGKVFTNAMARFKIWLMADSERATAKSAECPPGDHNQCLKFLEVLARQKNLKGSWSDLAKQETYLHSMLKNGYTFEEILSAAKKLDKDAFMWDKWDTKTIASYLDRKGQDVKVESYATH